jgi:hypothetical protein
MNSSCPWETSTICSLSLAFPGRPSRTPAWPRSQWVHVMLPSLLWKSWMLNMTKQIFQALLLLFEQEQEQMHEQEGDLDREQLLFQMKCPQSTKKSGLCAWPHRFSFWSDCICGHLSSRRIFSCSPSLCVKNDHGVNCLDGNCHVGIHRNCIGCFDGGCGTRGNDSCGLSHSYEQLEDEPSSFPSAASSPWACQGHRLLCWQFDTSAQKYHKPKTVHGHHFSMNLHWCALGWARKICSLFSCAVGCGQLHHLMEVAAIKVAEELYLMPHKLMHRHECGLPCNAKPMN